MRQLAARREPVRALVRPTSGADDLVTAGAQIVTGDLRDPDSLDSAVSGVTGIIATANVVAPSRQGDTHAAEMRGYSELIDRARRAGVPRFAYASVPVTRLDNEVPQLKAKRFVERRLAESGISHLSLRFAPFTEVWLALVGSSLPLRGEPRATLLRPYRFLRAFRKVSGRTIEDRGLMVLPGPATNRNAFISIHDAARALIAAIDVPDMTGAVDVGGPEVVSWAEVARTYADVLNRPVRVLSVPGAAFTVLQKLLAPVAPAAANIMGLNRMIAQTSTDWDTSEVTQRLGVHGLRTMRQVLQDKAALAAPG